MPNKGVTQATTTEGNSYYYDNKRPLSYKQDHVSMLSIMLRQILLKRVKRRNVCHASC